MINLGYFDKLSLRFYDWLINYYYQLKYFLNEISFY